MVMDTAVSEVDVVGGRYTVQDQLGKGGMGIVYQVQDRLTQQRVALKRVRIPDRPMKPSHADMMRVALAREFQTLASLRHPKIISVLDYGFDRAQQPFFTMALLDKPETILEAGRTSTAGQKIDLLAQMLQALVYLHRRGILHRDLKPGNVLVVNGEVKVLDFGLAIERETDHDFAGTITYMAPEVLAGEPHTEASDLFAVGIMAYQLFTGVYPFGDESGDAVQIARRLVSSSPDFTPLTAFERELSTMGGRDKSVRPSSPTNLASTMPDAGTLMFDQETIDLVPLAIPTIHFDVPSTQTESALTDAEKIALTTEDAVPEVTTSLTAIMRRLLNPSPQYRYQDAADVLRDLSRIVGEPLNTETALTRESFLQAARFIGRESEIAQLRAAFGETLTGRGSVWIVQGESGVGKSRLLDEVRVQALVEGALVVRGQAAERGAAYQLWNEPLRRLILTVDLSDSDASILKTIVPEISDLLGRLVADAEALEANEAQKRLLAAIRSLLYRQPQPTVIILEDLHWARADSIEILNQLRADTAQHPLLILASYREDEPNPLVTAMENVNRLRLHRLNEREIGQLSESMIGRAARQPHVSEMLNRETEGNVFFLVEVIRALAEQAGALEDIGAQTLPDQIFTGGVAQIVRNRLNRVQGADYELLQLAALLGREIDLDVLKAAAPGMDIERWLFACSEAMILDVLDERWRFAHDKLREVLLNETSGEPRARLHRQAAEAIEKTYPDTPRYAAALADHWRGAGDEAKERDAVTRAGNFAYDTGDMRNALIYLTRALTLMEGTDASHERKAEAQMQVAKVLGSLGQFADAQNRLADVLAQIGKQHPQVEAKAHFLMGRNQMMQGDYNAAKPTIEAAIVEFGDRRDSIVGDALISLAQLNLIQGAPAQAGEPLERGLTMYREQNNMCGTADALSVQADLDMRQGNLPGAEAKFMESLELHRRSGRRNRIAAVLMHLGMIAHYKGDAKGSIAQFEDSLKAFQEVGEQPGVATVLNNLGYVALTTGDLTQAEKYLEDSLKISQSLHLAAMIVSTLTNLGLINVEQKRFDIAAARFREALAIAAEHGVAPAMVELVYGFGRIEAGEDKPREAVRLLQIALAHPAAAPDVKEGAEAALAALKAQHGDAQIEVWTADQSGMTLETIVEELLKVSPVSATS